ncbi:hypothetical protein F511_47309 [Dorcoceras hygrometricum]|uniref:Uncharacterized protein n=1 Tax=Dorcoceras hygrometricum TaxID=472368 RepID=A0A2Z6ZRF2_9LAMI|nr:hypothetical protein F511_47309 [Dorcoceras hygrometricum]
MAALRSRAGRTIVACWPTMGSAGLTTVGRRTLLDARKIARCCAHEMPRKSRQRAALLRARYVAAAAAVRPPFGDAPAMS